MVIDFLVASRPSARQWSSISYIKALSLGMVIDSLCCIETLSMGLVIDSFTSRPSPMEWSLIFFLYIKALSNGMVIDILMFTSRPSPMEWSLIFLSLQQDPLQWNGHCFLLSHQGPLQWNGH